LKTNNLSEQEKPNWHLRPFLICYSVALILALTFFTDYRDPIWKAVDEAFFRLLNGTLTTEGLWTTLVAWTNTRIFDTIWGIVMGLLCVWVFISPRYGAFKDRFARISAAAFGVVTTIVVAKLAFRGFERLSPGRYFDDFINLNEILPHINAKVGSSSSFPGDHGIASVMLVLCFTVFFRTSPHLVLIALPIAIVNSLPRLIAGGHWFSDIAVGGGAIGLIVYPLLMGTPYLALMRKTTSYITDCLLEPVLKKSSWFKKLH